jgi:hypothetical protein
MWNEIITLLQKVFSSMALTSEDIINIIFSLLVSILIGFVISQVYKLTHRGVNFETTFMTSLVMLAPIVALVMFFIQGNLVLSLGLVGSLSIIRFRTPIKDTRDMVYLFWSIAVGLGAGTYHWGMVTIASIIIFLLVISLFFLKYGNQQSKDYILIINGSADFDRELIRNTIQQYAKDTKMRSQSFDKDAWEIVYELHLTDLTKPVDALMLALNEIDAVDNISLLAPQLSLPA